MRDVLELVTTSPIDHNDAVSDSAAPGTGTGRWTYLDGATYDNIPAARLHNAATVYFAWGNARDVRTTPKK